MLLKLYSVTFVFISDSSACEKRVFLVVVDIYNGIKALTKTTTFIKLMMKAISPGRFAFLTFDTNARNKVSAKLHNLSKSRAIRYMHHLPVLV